MFAKYEHWTCGTYCYCYCSCAVLQSMFVRSNSSWRISVYAAQTNHSNFLFEGKVYVKNDNIYRVFFVFENRQAAHQPPSPSRWLIRCFKLIFHISALNFGFRGKMNNLLMSSQAHHRTISLQFIFGEKKKKNIFWIERITYRCVCVCVPRQQTDLGTHVKNRVLSIHHRILFYLINRCKPIFRQHTRRLAQTTCIHLFK